MTPLHTVDGRFSSGRIRFLLFGGLLAFAARLVLAASIPVLVGPEIDSNPSLLLRRNGEYLISFTRTTIRNGTVDNRDVLVTRSLDEGNTWNPPVPVLSDNYSAVYGKRYGGQISIVTTSGTNQLHGSAFEFLRNSALDARNFFDYGASLAGGRRIPAFARNNFGAAVGGPIKKDKLFLFGNYEGFRQRLGLSNVAIVPDLNARQGLVPNASGQLVNVGVAPGVVPYLAIWPPPNGPTVGGGAARFFNSPSQSVREDFGTARADVLISDKDSLSGVLTLDDGVSLNPRVTNTFVTTVPLRNQVASITEIHIFSPTLLNTVTAGFSRSSFSSQDVPIINIPPSLPIIQGQTMGAITIGTTGGAGGGALSSVGAGNPFRSTRNLFTESDTVELTKGAHLITFGVWFQKLQENSNQGANLGVATFANLTALLQGQMQVLQANPFPTPLGFRSLEGAWFVQDNIKLFPNFTLNLGLRHEFTNGWNESHGRIAVFVPGPDNILLNKPRISDHLFTKNNARRLFGPRMGLAWDPFVAGKIAIRGGFGMYYNLLDQLAFLTSRNPPFNRTINIGNVSFPITQITPANYFTLPGAQVSPYGPDPQMSTPTLLSYNLKIDQSLGTNTIFSIGYAGTHTYHNIEQWDINTAFPVVCGAATQRYPVSAVTCPAAVRSGSLYYPAGSPRRNPLLATSKVFNSTSNGLYNALELEVRRRLTHGFIFKTNYTWSKSEDDNSVFAAPLNCATTLLNSEDVKTDWGVSCFNVKQRFSFAGSYELPLGAGKALWKNASDLATKFVGGWQVNAIVGIQSGLPVNAQLGFNQSRNASTANSDRPSQNPNFNGPLYLRTPNRWYNPNAFIRSEERRVGKECRL